MTGTIYDIQRFSLGNGPGIRTTVFMKGCPLRCIWCHNPESFSPAPQLMIDMALCRHCGRCVDVCTHGALIFKDETPRCLPKNCVMCGACVDACCFGVRRIVGRRIESDALIAELLRDRVYFDSSCGGITFSGGEPTMQSDFVVKTALRLRKEGVHVALDTCGHCDTAQYSKVLDVVDMVLFDLKHMDTERHKALTGVGNEKILANLQQTVCSGKSVKVRFPMVPGKNDDDENLVATAKLLIALGIDTLELSVYHDYGDSKYYGLGLTHAEIVPYSGNQIEEKCAFLLSCGITTVVI